MVTHAAPPSGTSQKAVLFGIGFLIIAYGIALLYGWPQKTTSLRVAAAAHQNRPNEQHGNAIDHEKNGTELPLDQPTKQPKEISEEKHAPPLGAALPFALLLGVIAIFPLIPSLAHWWESNRNRFIVAAILGVATLAYYLLLHGSPIEAHWPAHHLAEPSSTGANFYIAWSVFANAILNEFIPFIILLFSLYVVTGGIRIEGDLPAHPLTNTLFLTVGSLLASFVGTTGAAMLLIRPLLETNRERKHVVHTVIFFIFIVCNCGGCLLPIGDPPLFLGYLLGVPFLYPIQLWKEWAIVNISLLVIYYFWDHFWFYRHEAKPDIARDEARRHHLRFGGLWPNVPLLIGVIVSIALLDPLKTIPGTDWHPWYYLREIAQLTLVWLSLALGNAHLRRQNHFNYAAIIEVAALFFGIFLTMQPPLQILAERGPSLGLTEPWHFFWATGLLSSFLDNAPTYVVFFTTGQALSLKEGLPNLIAGVSEPLLAAISIGAVFMGANTYIGNGPNFMVKAIAEQSGVKMPGFFGYMLYSFGLLIPLFILCSLLFFD